jgi:hypothetical protein
MPDMHRFRLTHPDLDFWVDVRLREFDGKWLAVADLADEPEIGLGEDRHEAVLAALRPIGDRYAADMAAGLIDRSGGTSDPPEGHHES